MKLIISIVAILISSLFIHLVYSDWFNIDFAFSRDQFAKYLLLLIVFALIPTFNKVYKKELKKPNGKPKLIYPFAVGIPVALMTIIYQNLELNLADPDISLNYIGASVTLLIFYIIFYIYGVVSSRKK